MNLKKKVFLIVYRVKEKGLEILLTKDQDQWVLPQGTELDPDKAGDQIIELEPTDDDEARVMAIEADWHEIPSLRKLIKEDVKVLSEKVWEIIPKLEQSTYVAVKDAFKNFLPETQYKMLKELKDIITDRNTTKDI